MKEDMDHINALKAMARKANERQESDRLRRVIAELDRVWNDDRAAMAFYTELEQSARNKS
jgi:hypothetical protein